MFIQNRREFLKTTATAAGALGLGVACAPSDDQEAAGPAPMSILVLGGTGFIGPHMVRYAVSRGHTVTLFNRGRTNTHLFPELEKLVGDRDGDLAALEGRRWDAVIDNSGFVPRHVRDSAALLSDSGQYMFVSSISAYKDLVTEGITEDYDVGRLEVRRGVSLRDANSGRAQPGRDRRRGEIGPAHLVAGAPQELCDAAHSDAADAHHVDSPDSFEHTIAYRFPPPAIVPAHRMSCSARCSTLSAASGFANRRAAADISIRRPRSPASEVSRDASRCPRSISSTTSAAPAAASTAALRR